MCQIVFLCLLLFQLCIGYNTCANALTWKTCDTCLDTPDVNIVKDSIRMGQAAEENQLQNVSIHGGSAELPAADGYLVDFEFDFNTWDSYDAGGTPNDPYNGQTGFWDSFAVNISKHRYWRHVELSDPLDQNPYLFNGFIWGGLSFGDETLEKWNGALKVFMYGNSCSAYYLNAVLDTQKEPDYDENYPSYGSITISKVTPVQINNVLFRSVPHFKQFDPRWWKRQPDDYFVKQYGCYITSIAMVLRYYGITTGKDGYEVNPSTLYRWLKINGALDKNGNLANPNKVAEYTNNKIRYDACFRDYGKRDDMLIDQISKDRPVILNVGGHFVVATGNIEVDGVRTWSVNDPGYSKVATRTNYIDMRLFKPGTGNNGHLNVSIACPAELLITDSQGRRTGFDPSTLKLVNEIPEGSYGHEFLNDDNDENGMPTQVTKIFDLHNPENNRYSIQVIGTGSGEYTMKISVFDYSGHVNYEDTHTGSINEGESVGIDIDYNGGDPPKLGDLDGDGDIDLDDIEILVLSRNTDSSEQADRRDLDNDGRITALDARKLAQMCTNRGCATGEPMPYSLEKKVRIMR